MENKLATIVRMVTVPPVVSGLVVVLLWFVHHEMFQSRLDFLVGLTGLAFIPLASYLVWFLVPRLKQTGREGQRKTAMYFCVGGYLVSFVYAVAVDTSVDYRIMMCSYLVSVIFLIFCNKVLHFKASGHACSIAGPALFVALYCQGGWDLLSLVVLVAVVWSSLRLKRHKPEELMIGGAISALSIFLLIGIL